MTRNKTFLFTSWEGGGNIPPVITVARKLRARGHRVRLMSDRANAVDAAAAGLDFHPWQTAPSRLDRKPTSCPFRDWEASSPQEGIGRLLDSIVFGAALDYARDLSAVLDDEPADLVVTSEMLMGVLAGCEARNQPSALLSANLCMYPINGMPVMGPGLPPPRTEEEKNIHDQVRAGTIAMLDAHLETLNRARQALGLSPLSSTLKQLDAAKRYLLGTARAFDFQDLNPPASIRYVGAQLDEPDCLHVYFTGCAGNISAGKYNDGSKPVRPILTKRLYDGIVASEAKLERAAVKSDSLAWKTAEIMPPPLKSLHAEKLAQQISTKTNPVVGRNRPSYMLSWLRRVEKRTPIVLSSLHLGGAKLLHLPADVFHRIPTPSSELRQGPLRLHRGLRRRRPVVHPSQRGIPERRLRSQRRVLRTRH